MEDNEDQLACRICELADRFENLISPCNCSGCSRFVHPECLRCWLQSRRVVRCRDCAAQLHHAIAEVSCRICLDSDQLTNLLSPCRCRGSIRFVHRHCLAKWMQLNSTVACNICLTPFAGVDYQLVEGSVADFIRENQLEVTFLGLGFVSSLLSADSKSTLEYTLDLSVSLVVFGSLSFFLWREYQDWKKRNFKVVVIV